VLAFVKLGGSLITDKRVEASFRALVVDRIARELRSALDADADLRLLVGHGSGSFGHFAASRYRTVEGVRTLEEWRGFAQVATVASELNRLVSHSFLAAGVPVWPIQPSASACCRDGELVEMVVDPIRQALACALVPLVYGDVALD
jgi:isopentenyl phosphate kinase